MLHIDDPDIFIFDLDISIHKTINLWYRYIERSRHTHKRGRILLSPRITYIPLLLCCIAGCDRILLVLLIHSKRAFL
jgi:hypothetical protein